MRLPQKNRRDIYINFALMFLTVVFLIFLAVSATDLSKKREALSLLSDKVCQLVVEGDYLSGGNYGEINCYKKII